MKVIKSTDIETQIIRVMDDLGNRDIQGDPPDLEIAAQGAVLSDPEPEINQVAAVNVHQQVCVEIPPHPPDNWSFNNLLAEIARGIHESELNTLKLMFEDNFSRVALEECNSCERFFSLLKTRRYISPGNITYLNRMLDVLQRGDLIEKAARYCRTNGNVIHYYTIKDITETGTNRVKFHIVTNIQTMSRDTIDKLRNNVAKIVCVPVERVLIEEVMPGSSLIVVLSLPDIHFHILEMFLEEKADLWELLLLEVDKVEINDKVYHLEDLEKPTESSQQMDFLNVYEQLQQKCEELENVDFQALYNCDEIERLDKQLEKCKTVIKSLLQRIDMLQKNNLELKIIISTFQDKYIHNQKDMLNTKTVEEYARYQEEAQREKENAFLNERQVKEKLLLRSLTTKLTSPKDIMQYHYCHVNPGHTLDDKLIKRLRMLNEDLSEDDRTKLWNNYTSTEHDVMKACIEKDESLFLAGILCKETIRTGCVTSIVEFIKLVQQKTNKADLMQKWMKTPVRLYDGQLTRVLKTMYIQLNIEL